MSNSAQSVLRYDGLYEYAQRNRLSYNELCSAVRAALTKPEEVPKTVNVNGIPVPEPVREPLEVGQVFWIARSSGEPNWFHWRNESKDYEWLSFGIIHMTQEAAQLHTDAMLAPTRTIK